jgi:hypothetical protein
MMKNKKIHEVWKIMLDGRTNEWLCKKTGITPSEVSRILSGKLIPSEKQKVRINEALTSVRPSIAKPNVIRGCQHELVLIEGKEWFCWLCKKYEKELIQMQNRNSSAGTTADSSTNDEVTMSSQTIAKPCVMRRTMFKCVVCGKLTAGRIGREVSMSGDMSHRFPRRHKVGGQDCLGNIEEAEWVDVPYGA